MAVRRRFIGVERNRLTAGLAAILAMLAAPALVAQNTGAPAGKIETERLEPLDRPEGSRRDDAGGRFKLAPFRTLVLPTEPELIEPVETAPREGARLRQLDKMTGRTQTFEIAAGSQQMSDRLRIRLAACRSPDDNAQHGTMAFLQIWDTGRDGAEPVFSGWMFAESPALSALDHPRYDVWVISCTIASGEAPVASE